MAEGNRDLLESLSGGLGGLLTGLGAAYGVVKTKFSGVHKRIDTVNERMDDAEETLNAHTTAIAVLQTQLEADKEHRDRVESTQRAILYEVQKLRGGSH